MLFINRDIRLELRVLGYEYPHLAAQPYDADWLMIGLRVQSLRFDRETNSSALMTQELRDISSWLAEILRNGEVFTDWSIRRCPVKTTIGFIEPNLCFEIQSTGRPGYPFNFRVALAAAFLPPFAAALPHSPFQQGQNIDEVCLDFYLTASELAEIQKELHRELQNYPVRVELS